MFEGSALEDDNATLGEVGKHEEDMVVLLEDGPMIKSASKLS